MQDNTNDEIDLFEIIEIIWNGKLLISAITGVSVMLCTAVALILPPSFEGRIDIAALDKTQLAAFAPLNDTPGISQPIYARDNLIGYEGVIHSEDLYNAFIAELRLGQFFSEAHKKIDPKFINFNGDEVEKREELLELREDYELKINRDDPMRGTLQFTSGDRELAREIVEIAFNAINDDVRRDHLEGISNLQRSIKASLNYEIGEVERKIANATANYEVSIAARVADLTEQAAIARQLGIAGDQAVLAARGTNGIGINVNSNLPLYLRGFNALEKEIALINGRGSADDILLHVPNYPEMAANLRALETDNLLERIEKSLLLTPLASGEPFIAASYDLDAIIFKKTLQIPLVLFLGALVGGIIAVIFVLTRHFMIQRNQNA